MERRVIKTVQGYRTTDGAGVSLVRVLGNETIDDFDPILMLDSFDSQNPAEYRAGFPTHPHRGIETVSFLAKGTMVHRDHLGNEQAINDGEAQWLTAGSGAFHSEMLPGKEGMLGAQLWLNMPQKDKMAPPAYHGIMRDEIQEIPLEHGLLRLVAGNYKEYSGYQGKYLPLDYYDLHLDANASITIDTDHERSVMVFTLVGDAVIGGKHVAPKTAAKLGEGDSVTIEAGDKGSELLFISSVRLNEPVAWYGPVVMNTRAEIKQTIRELNDGTFLKKGVKY